MARRPHADAADQIRSTSASQTQPFFGNIILREGGGGAGRFLFVEGLFVMKALQALGGPRSECVIQLDWLTYENRTQKWSSNIMQKAAKRTACDSDTAAVGS